MRRNVEPEGTEEGLYMQCVDSKCGKVRKEDRYTKAAGFKTAVAIWPRWA